ASRTSGPQPKSEGSFGSGCVPLADSVDQAYATYEKRAPISRPLVTAIVAAPSIVWSGTRSAVPPGLGKSLRRTVGATGVASTRSEPRSAGLPSHAMGRGAGVSAE